MNLIDFLIAENWLKTPTIVDAFKKIKREDFLPDNLKKLAEVNEALPIGSGQTISQPAVVAFMLEELQPKFGEKILDIGSGSGWTSALLAQIVSGAPDQGMTGSGRVVSIEIVPELKEMGEKNIAQYGFVEKNIVKLICFDGSKGYPLDAPYDKILVSASAPKIPKAWKEQLKVGGRIVAPVGNSIITLIKRSATKFEQIEHPGFVFVPLIENK